MTERSDTVLTVASVFYEPSPTAVQWIVLGTGTHLPVKMCHHFVEIIQY